MGASQPHSGSASSSSSSAPRSRMYRRPERIGWSAPRVASSTPSQSRTPAWREKKRRTRPAANMPLGRFRFAASREKCRVRSVARNRRQLRRPRRARYAGWSRSGRSRGRSLAASLLAWSEGFVTSEFVLNVSLLNKILLSSRTSTFRQRNVNDLSHCNVCAAA